MGVWAQAGGGAGFAFLLLQFALIFAIVYFLLILPQRREQRRHQELVRSLRRGDRVVTMGGLVGEIVGLSDDTVTLKTGDARVAVQRTSVMRRLEPAAAESGA